MDRYLEVSERTTYWYEIEAEYEESKERLQERNYYLDLKLRKLK